MITATDFVSGMLFGGTLGLCMLVGTAIGMLTSRRREP